MPFRPMAMVLMMVAPGGMIHPARVALVLGAELALGVAALGHRLGQRDSLGILFRLGDVNTKKKLRT